MFFLKDRVKKNGHSMVSVMSYDDKVVGSLTHTCVDESIRNKKRKLD